MAIKFNEQTKRSTVKTLTFHFLIICADGVIIFLITHRLDQTVGVIILSNLASIILYFTNERIWNKIHWGKT